MPSSWTLLLLMLGTSWQVNGKDRILKACFGTYPTLSCQSGTIIVKTMVSDRMADSKSCPDGNIRDCTESLPASPFRTKVAACEGKTACPLGPIGYVPNSGCSYADRFTITYSCSEDNDDTTAVVENTTSQPDGNDTSNGQQGTKPVSGNQGLSDALKAVIAVLTCLLVLVVFAVILLYRYRKESFKKIFRCNCHRMNTPTINKTLRMLTKLGRHRTSTKYAPERQQSKENDKRNSDTYMDIDSVQPSTFEGTTGKFIQWPTNDFSSTYTLPIPETGTQNGVQGQMAFEEPIYHQPIDASFPYRSKGEGRSGVVAQSADYLCPIQSVIDTGSSQEDGFEEYELDEYDDDDDLGWSDGEWSDSETETYEDVALSTGGVRKQPSVSEGHKPKRGVSSKRQRSNKQRSTKRGSTKRDGAAKAPHTSGVTVALRVANRDYEDLLNGNDRPTSGHVYSGAE